jgi:CHAT domain-containing protein
MTNEEKVEQLIHQADQAHTAGNIDDEIDLRLGAFVLSEKLPSPAVGEIEKIAHLLCDISEELVDPASDEEWNQATRHADKRHGFFEGAVLELLKALSPERAFMIMQRLKSPFLVRRLRAHTRSRVDLSKTAISYRDLLTKKDALQNQLRQARRDKQTPAKLRALETKKSKLQARLLKAEQRLREEDPKALASFGAQLQPDDLLPLFPPDGSAALVDFYLSSGQLMFVFAFREGEHVNMVGGIAYDLEVPDLVKETQNWFKALDSGQPEQVNAGLQKLALFLHDNFLCSIGQFLAQRGLSQVTFIPHSMMHALPLHLAPLCETNNDVLFGEQFSVNYASCIQLALTTALRPRPAAFVQGKLNALLLSDPIGDLPAARYEQQRVAYQMSNHTWPAAKVDHDQLIGTEATLDGLELKMANAGLIDLATHASFLGGDPFGSGLYLSVDGGEKKLWSIDQIYTGTHLTSNPVVILSACESGMNYFNDSAEIVAIPPAFVSIGASAVLATLWRVEDVSTSFLAERFVYHLMDPGETPATSLHEACKDIQQVSRDQALERVEDILTQMEDQETNLGVGKQAYLQLSGLRERIANGPDKPFASPLFWGAFFVTGCGWRTIEGKGVIMKNAQASMDMIEAIAQVQFAYESFKAREFKESADILRKAVPSLDGLWLGRALLLLGESIYRQPQTGRMFNVEQSVLQAKESLETLQRAFDVLTAQGDDSAAYCEQLIEEVKTNL